MSTSLPEVLIVMSDQPRPLTPEQEQVLVRLLDEFEEHFGTHGDVGLIEVRRWIETTIPSEVDQEDRRLSRRMPHVRCRIVSRIRTGLA